MGLAEDLSYRSGKTVVLPNGGGSPISCSGGIEQESDDFSGAVVVG